MKTKICLGCKGKKLLDCFYKNKHRKDRYNSWCKKCNLQYNKTYKQKNKEAIKEYKIQYRQKNKEAIKEYNKQHYQKNKENIREQKDRYYQTNKEHLDEQRKQYRQANKECFNKYRAAYGRLNRDKTNKHRRQKRLNDTSFKLSWSIRSRLCSAVRHNYKAGSAVCDLGCTIKHLKNYLESQFQPGMTWDNWGRVGWHIDHIKPLSRFNLTDREQLLEAVHYTNLQPLWAKDNISKGNRII